MHVLHSFSRFNSEFSPLIDTGNLIEWDFNASFQD